VFGGGEPHESIREDRAKRARRHRYGGDYRVCRGIDSREYPAVEVVSQTLPAPVAIQPSELAGPMGIVA
jgi:hypothetical protein